MGALLGMITPFLSQFKIYIILAVFLAGLGAGGYLLYRDMRNTIQSQATVIGTLQTEAAVTKDTLAQMAGTMKAASESMRDYNAKQAAIHEEMAKVRKDLESRGIAKLAVTDADAAGVQVNDALSSAFARIEAASRGGSK